MAETEIKIEYELIATAVALELHVASVKKEPTTADDWHLRIEGQLSKDAEEAEDHVEWGAIPLIYVLGVFSFADARPRGYSEIHYSKDDDWTAADMLRHLQFERGALHFYADYVRGRMLKTTVEVRKDGTFTLETINRGEAATRWLGKLEGKKTLRLVPAGEAESLPDA
jgi:hypothetical protein